MSFVWFIFISRALDADKSGIHKKLGLIEHMATTRICLCAGDTTGAPSQYKDRLSPVWGFPY